MYDYCTALKLERHDNGVLVLTLDNPPTNAVNTALHDDLRRVLEDVNTDAQTKVLERTRARLEELERRFAELESKLPPGG